MGTLIIIIVAILLTIVGVRVVTRAFRSSLQTIIEGELAYTRAKAEQLQARLDSILLSNQVLAQDNTVLKDAAVGLIKEKESLQTKAPKKPGKTS